jgi:hypothetical protein
VLIAGFLLWIVHLAVTEGAKVSATPVSIVIDAAVNLSVLGLARGLAGLLARFRPRFAGIGAVVVAGLVLGGFVLVTLLLAESS